MTAVGTFNSERVYTAAAGGYAEISERLWSWAPVGLVARVGELRPDAAVLDAGCGPGSVSVRLARSIGPRGHVTAFDVSEEMLAQAREHARWRGVRNVTFQRGDMASPNIDGTGNGYDAVTAGLSLFLAPDITQAAAALWRRVRPGGRLAVSVVAEQFFTPAFEELLSALSEACGGGLPDIPWQRVDHRLTLKAALEDAGIPAPEIAVEIRQVPLDNASDWQEIMLGTGIRFLLDQVDEPTRGEVERASIAHVCTQRLRSLAFGVIYAVADKPN